MKYKIKDIASLSSGIYSKPELPADTLYLQSVHFNESGNLIPYLKPQINSKGKNKKYLLKKDDILFAAKGTNNFGVVYNTEYGLSVASSSFIVLQINQQYKEIIAPSYLAWFLSFTDAFIQHHQKQLGTTIPSISIKKLGEVEIDIPDLDTQKRIVKVQQLRYREKEIIRKLEAARDQWLQHTLNNAVKFKT